MKCPLCEKGTKPASESVTRGAGGKSVTVNCPAHECVSGCKEDGGGTLRFFDHNQAMAVDNAVADAWKKKYGENIPSRQAAKRKKK